MRPGKKNEKKGRCNVLWQVYYWFPVHVVYLIVGEWCSESVDREIVRKKYERKTNPNLIMIDNASF